MEMMSARWTLKMRQMLGLPDRMPGDHSKLAQAIDDLLAGREPGEWEREREAIEDRTEHERDLRRLGSLRSQGRSLGSEEFPYRPSAMLTRGRLNSYIRIGR